MNRPSKIASFDVDAQKGFTPLCPDELPVPGGDAIGAPSTNWPAAPRCAWAARTRTARRLPG